MGGVKNKWGLKNVSDHYLSAVELEYPLLQPKHSADFTNRIIYTKTVVVVKNKIPETTTMEHIIRIFRINIYRSSMFQKWAGRKFIFINITATKNSPETKLLDIINCHI